MLEKFTAISSIEEPVDDRKHPIDECHGQSLNEG